MTSPFKLQKLDGKALSNIKEQKAKDLKGNPLIVSGKTNLPFDFPACPPPVEPKVDGISYLGQKIKVLRKEKRLSQQALAKKAGIGRGTVQRAEEGGVESLSMRHLGKIAKALGVDRHRLVMMNLGSEVPLMIYRENEQRIVFSLDYPEEGFRIVSPLPLMKEVFIGMLEIKPQKEVDSKVFGPPVRIHVYPFSGKLIFIQKSREIILKPAEGMAFSGYDAYQLYNPDMLKVLSCQFITTPSFIHL